MAPVFRKNILHRLFDIGVWIKGIDGILEIIGGILFLSVSTATLNTIVIFLTQHELAEDPRDFVANALRHAASHLSANTKLYGGVYLIGTGAVKIFLAAGLLLGRLWTYPAALVFLCTLICYQLYRLSYHYSTGLLILTILDSVIVALIWNEYRRIRHVNGQ